MKITFSGQEVNSAFVCKLADLGLTNVNPDSVKVSVKSLRDGSGDSEAEVEFSTAATSSPQIVATASTEERPPETKPEDSTADRDDSEDSGSGDSNETSSIFGS